MNRFLKLFFFLLQSLVVIGMEQKAPFFPIFYHSGYNLSFFGIEKLHPFDAAKYKKVHEHLKKEFNLDNSNFYTPTKITEDQLLTVHTKEYLESLKSSSVVAYATEILPLILLPNWIVQKRVLDPMRLATDGTVKAVKAALDPNNPYKVAINLSGGYHHAQADKGEGFCVYADIPLAIQEVWKTNSKAKILYVDLDAHQGNGVELILENEMKADNPRFAVFDIYGANNYPGDYESKRVRDEITYNFPQEVRTGQVTDDAYLNIVRTHLPRAITDFNPDLIVYNAGTDPYESDQLGGMNLTAQGIKERDYCVFELAKNNNIPLAMTLSGGYSKESARIIGESITNIMKKVHEIKPIERNSLWFAQQKTYSILSADITKGLIGVGIAAAAISKYKGWW